MDMALSQQLPEGLKVHATRVVDAIGECSDAEVLIFVDPTYGACDIKSQMCERLDIDLLVHFGHTPYVGGLLKG